MQQETSRSMKKTKKSSFHAKMKLFHSRKSRYKFFKCAIFLSICLYFLICRHKPAAISTTTISRSEPSLALMAENNLDSSALGSFNGMKIYVYDLPAKFNRKWLRGNNERCSNHLFAAEVAIHRALMSSEVRTLEPRQADLFFVPVYVSCNFSEVNGFPAIGHARSLIAAAIQHVSSMFPFWNRSRGSDHVFVASHDFGSCFHTMEDRAKSEGVPEFLRNSIILQTFGVRGKHPCQEVEHVVVPPYVSPESVSATLKSSPVTGRRDIFAFFRGKMEVHPKNVSGQFYSKRVRTAILRRYGNDGRFYLRRHRFAGYQSEIARAKFCLCPLGWAPWSPRLVESVALGCVPVIIADGIRLPFPAAVPWADISLTVAEADVDGLGGVLERVAATNLTAIQRNLRDPRVRKALLFGDTVSEGDATWQVLVALSGKLGRSHKRLKRVTDGIF
ncbi:putative glucuronoxylan glucuronosyltransferase irx7 [Salvia divinorum]|uniref:Glucuronoxylan glucuronosyltransferase irx7 n=1 Tax=Salvia divinorum TaxID=28513 RepID=A0ABD1GT29_SALDI